MQIAGLIGFDSVWLCTEHVPTTMQDIEGQIMWAKLHDMDTVVRVPRGSYSDLVQPLEADAAGIMVPHCMGLADAEALVKQARFHPVGLRPVDGGNVDGGFCMIPFTEYIEQANRERFIIVQIEDPEPLDELDAICQVEGIDMIFFGAGDFSHAIGQPGNVQHPAVRKARVQVAETANKYGKVAAINCAPDGVQGMIDMGYRFVACGADVVGLGAYWQQVADEFAKVLG